MIVLYRSSVAGNIEDREEISAIKQLKIPLEHQRIGIVGKSQVVVPRYFLWPYPREVIQDIVLSGCTPINDLRATMWFRDIGEWSPCLRGHTPETWTWAHYSQNMTDDGPVVLKGAEKSYGHQWDTHMFGKNRAEAVQRMMALQSVGMDVDEIYVRRYVPLHHLPVSCEIENQPPCAEEYRFFVLDGKILCSGFYWSSRVEFLSEIPSPDVVPRDFLYAMIGLIAGECHGARLFVLDVARKANGDWIVVEINDGCSAGLSNIDPLAYYSGLAGV